MRVKLLGLLFLPLALPLAGCGGSNGPADLSAACTGSSFCVISCSLGCSRTNGCAVREIALNQAITFDFSQPVDLGSVGPASFSLRTAAGAEPLGDLIVQGNTVQFQPAVIVREGRNVYGFQENATYVLELQGGPDAISPIRSISGDMLAKGLRCELVASLGVVDFDGRNPEGSLVIPAAQPNAPGGFHAVEIEPGTLIVLEFSEVINTATFTSGGTGGGIFYQVALPDAKDPSGQRCLPTEFPLPGSVSVNVFETPKGARATRVIFRPSLLLPSESCIRVQLTNQIRDLSGKGAIGRIWRLKVKERQVEDQAIEEDFDSQAKLDKERSGAEWGGGALKPGKLGDSGILGEFAAVDGMDINEKDSQGRDIYVWNTENEDISEGRTLTGQTITVTNGVFNFLKVHVKANEHIRFVGKNIPQIRSAGMIQIDGAIEMPVPKPPTRRKDLNLLRGIEGGAGGTGGAPGGQGGDVPTYTGTDKLLNGRPGGDVVLPAGHPGKGQAAGTGGEGSLAHPKSGKESDIHWIVDTGIKIFVGMVAAGGGGGSLWDTGNGSLLGTGGKAEKTAKERPFWPYLPGGVEFGPPSKGGKAFLLPKEANDLWSSSKPSTELFMIGGAGGGGSGMHPLYTVDERKISWSPGAGAAGGGGVVGFQSGADFVVGDKAEILVKGGDANDQPNNNTLPPVHAPGGAGSGGSVLIQAGGLPQIVGTVSVAGGRLGQLIEKTLLWVASIGGSGGAGYIRVEADPKPSHTSFPRLIPPATAGNVGLLRKADYADVSVAVSKWYATQSLFPPQYLYYEIKTKIDNVDVTFSDDSTLGKPAVEGEAIVLLVQSADVDAKKGEAISTPTDWLTGQDITRLNNDPKYKDKTGNGLRFYLKLDKPKTQTGAIEVLSIKFAYRG